MAQLLVGTMVYLELIELKFFKLDENLKINIEMRSLSEYQKDNLYNDDDNDSEIDNNENNLNSNKNYDNKDNEKET